MEKHFSIIYANRNRSPERIAGSFNSLKKQSANNFEVVFVDFGSDPELVKEYRKVAASFDFVRFHNLDVSQLLWNKSKALNFGILKATSPYIFIADVDLIFHPESLSLFNKLAAPGKFYLFKLGYLNEKESLKLSSEYEFEDLKSIRSGAVNGMVLAEKKAFLKVGGLDEFFHFYGAEDEDLFARFENAGYSKEEIDSEYFYHNWHKSFSGSEDILITKNPRVKNIMRINQRHFQRNRERGVIKPYQQNNMGVTVSPEESSILNKPSQVFEIKNILSHVEHFLREELPLYKGESVEVRFVEDPYFSTYKHKIKKSLGMQTQVYISLKEVNDIVLKEILFRYRDSNYSFHVNDDFKSVTFRICQ